MPNLHAASWLASGAYNVITWASEALGNSTPLPLPTCSIYNCLGLDRLRSKTPVAFLGRATQAWHLPCPGVSIPTEASPSQLHVTLPRDLSSETLNNSRPWLLSTAILSLVSFVPLKSVPGGLCC